MLAALKRISNLFPAWAGVIPMAAASVSAAMAIPRMGGGDPMSSIVLESNPTYSPHGRG